jgi:PAS domain S-box-containing protein
LKEPYHFSKQETGKQGEKIFINSDSAMLGNISGEDVKILLNELEESYQSLDDERAKFVSLYDLAPVGYFILNYLGIITDVNERGVDLLKASKDSVLFKRFQTFITPESWEDFYSFLHQTESFADRQSTEIKLLLGNNEIAYTRVEGIAVQNDIPKQIKYYIAVIDITESRKSQLKLQETKDRLEMTLNASSTGIWTIDSYDHKVYLDDYSYAILGLQPGEFDGSIKHILPYIHPDDQEKMRYSLWHGITRKEDIDVELRVVTNSGPVKYISFKGHEVPNPKSDRRCFAGIMMDVTTRKGLEREAENLRKNQQRLILSATLMAQEKERSIISNALHDSVCQILYGIRLNLQNFQITNNLKEEFINVNQLLDQAIRETRQLSYELTPSVLKDFGFTAGIKEMSQRLSTPIFQVKSSINSAADHLPLQVQLYLFRIIQELINNSIKHSNASQAEIKVKIDNNQVTVIVSDNGRGFNMPENDALRNGSGLRGIKNRVFLLDGEITIESSPGGTTIFLNFKNDISLADIERL